MVSQVQTPILFGTYNIDHFWFVQFNRKKKKKDKEKKMLEEAIKNTKGEGSVEVQPPESRVDKRTPC